MPIPAEKAERLNEVYNFLTGFLDESQRTEPAYITLKDGSTRLFRGKSLDIDDQNQISSPASSNDDNELLGRKTLRKSSRSQTNRRQSLRKNRK
jgi:hypothetical protein